MKIVGFTIRNHYFCRSGPDFFFFCFRALLALDLEPPRRGDSDITSFLSSSRDKGKVRILLALDLESPWRGDSDIISFLSSSREKGKVRNLIRLAPCSFEHYSLALFFQKRCEMVKSNSAKEARVFLHTIASFSQRDRERDRFSEATLCL